MIDIRDHGGPFNGGAGIDTTKVAIRTIGTTSTGINWGACAFNDEKDGICVGTYLNHTGGDYRVYGMLNNQLNFKSSNFESNLFGIERDEDNVYVSTSSALYKLKINPGVEPTRLWYASLTNSADSIALLPNGNIVVNNSGEYKVRIINSFGVFIKDINIPRYANRVVADPSDSDVVYVICEYYTIKLKISTGTEIWRTGTEGSTPNDAFYLNGFIYQVNNLYNAFKINANTGAIVQGPLKIYMSSLTKDANRNIYAYSVDMINYLGKESLSVGSGLYQVSNVHGANSRMLKLGKKKQYSINGSTIREIMLHYGIK